MRADPQGTRKLQVTFCFLDGEDMSLQFIFPYMFLCLKYFVINSKICAYFKHKVNFENLI